VKARLFGAAVALAAAAVLAGCGAGQLKPATGANPANQLLTQAAVEKFPDGPVRAFYQWWLYVQYNDQAGYLRMLAPSLRRAEQNSPLLSYELPVSARQLDVALPAVLSVSEQGPHATLYTQLYYHQLVGAARFTTVQVPQAFSLVKIRNHWYIEDDNFIIEQSRATLVAAGVIPSRAAGYVPRPKLPSAAATGLPGGPQTSTTTTRSRTTTTTATTTSRS
jgi:hypothetical protein